MLITIYGSSKNFFDNNYFVPRRRFQTCCIKDVLYRNVFNNKIT